MEDDIFLSEIGSGFGESGGTTPPRIPRSTPGEPIPVKYWSNRTINEFPVTPIPRKRAGGGGQKNPELLLLSTESTNLSGLRSRCQKEQGIRSGEEGVGNLIPWD